MRQGCIQAAFSLVVLLAAYVITQPAWSAGEWSELKSRHFIVYYKLTPIDFAREVLNASEQAFQQISNDLGFTRDKGWDFDDRARIYIFDNQQAYIESAKQSQWSAGTAFYTRRTIKTYPAANGFFDSVLPHELGHIIFYEFIGNPYANIPRWFEEGVAMYQEKARRWGAHQDVKKAMADGTFVPLDQLSQVSLAYDSSRETVDAFYAESASAVYFLIKEYGDFRFLNFCRQMKLGNTFERAFELAYPHIRTISQFNSLWVSHIERQ